MLLLNDLPVKFFKFPGGEIQVKLDNLQSERATLTWKPQNSDDIMLLLLTVNALRYMGCRDIILDVLYLPYGRQDKICNAGEALSLFVIIKILDNLDLSLITLWDSHNDHTSELFSKTPIIEIEILDTFLYFNFLKNFDLPTLYLCAPDYGSRFKVNQISNKFDLNSALHFDKVRCPSTGIITSLTPNEFNPDIKGYNILVIDDICDGGSTFIKLAEELRKQTDGNLYLYVTHGIFSKGFDELYKHYDHIYCHHVLNNHIRSSERLTILREFPNVSQSAVCY